MSPAVPRFSIELSDRPTTRGITTGRIVLGDFAERFEAPLNYWAIADYRRSWRDSVRRIVDGATASALVTSMVDPVVANFIRWWPLYRSGPEVRVHEHLLMVGDLPHPVDPADLDEFVPEYRSTSEDGAPISEWRLPVASFEAFLEPRRE